ncbi:MAG: HDOD domain-containing protein [Phycisphaerales bacterium]
MNPEILDKVLSCKQLPSLPAIATRVLELTQDKNVSMKEIADTISNDQGLSSKILRTVNSSFYALRKPCASVNQAIVMLGLSAVKTLALGFSLVSTIKIEGDGFDIQAYWRRTLIAGIAGKCIAADTKIGNDEECFLGGLLQDVGMVALYMALGKEYTDVLAQAGGEHQNLTRNELLALEISHAEVGALLATRWKLPPELVMPVRYHERPSAAPQEYVKLVQAVALGNIATDVITSPEPGVALKKFYAKAESWFSLKNNQSDEVIKKVSQGAKEIARLLAVDVGQLRSPDEILSSATHQLENIALPFDGTGEGGPGAGDALTVDPVTGLPSERVLNQNIVAGFEKASATCGSFSIAFLEIDQLAELAPKGRHMVDEALKEAAKILRAQVALQKAILCRVDGDGFGVVMQGLDRLGATRLVEQARIALSEKPVSLCPPGLKPISITLTASAGVASFDATTRARFNEPDALVETTRNALAAARKSGQSAVRVYTPRAAA